MDASELRYDDLVDRVEVLYNDHHYRAAADLLAAESGGLEAWAAELAHVRACVLGADGDADGAMQVLLDASTAGAWWAPEILVDDDDLEALQDRPAFHELIKVSEARVADDPVPPLVTLPDGQPVGVVVALHGAGQRAGHARRDWSGVLELGYALVCVQSSRRMSPMYRTWPDPEHALADIARALAQLPAEVEHLPLIAAGFSAGGRVAIDWALRGRPAAVAGVLAVAPALRELPDATAEKLSPATIWIGTGDDLLEVVDGAADQLTGFTIERLPGLGHAFPSDFADRLSAVLQDS
ncbi:serine aminopeptidase domain-containing protein [Kribbella speibonae]|uniref:Phospholipase n=1 Tax=Kribbella speibonae TaxID=1572660 RepID=A0ABY2AFW5_9ACTN|nr:alpha/beta hydrolase [Kribbella speibonae]TCC27707.1 phospholipase [Kribbella speibonae]